MSEKKEGEIIDDLDASTKPFYGEDLGTKNVSKLLVEARQSLKLSQKEIQEAERKKKMNLSKEDRLKKRNLKLQEIKNQPNAKKKNN